MFPARSFAGKTVAIFGLARSGLTCARALVDGGAKVLAWDDTPAGRSKAEEEGIPVADLSAIDFRTLDALVLSPGVPLTHPSPHWTVEKARAAGVEIIGDIEVFAREIAGKGARLVGITGTNGKSTTTALTGHLLKAAGLDAHVGGNIGTAVFLLPPPQRGRIYVLELSSYQIDLMPALKPDAGILMNLTPDHLDRHGTMANYAAVKAHMFAQQAAGDTAICSVDDDWCAEIEARLEAASEAKVVPFSVMRSLKRGVSAPEGILVDTAFGDVPAELDLRRMPALRGRHNWQNACAAYAAARAMGLTLEEIDSGMRSFPGLAHRMEEVGRLDDVAFINDSKATNADAAEKALTSFDTIYWIAGGLQKAGGIEPLRPYFPRVVRAYLIGQDGPEFAKTLDGAVDYRMCGTIDRAVADAAADAAREGKPGAVVLLSPACASFDQYPNFEVRGEAFRAAVASLAGIAMKGATDADQPK
ncbi:MAG: UDP-N-acetylmuramoyl-L-alanine--D-glutamate ligase [Hyphomicrobiales bacterium]